MSEPVVVVVVDSREQRPYRFARSRKVGLDCGDYTGEGVVDTLRIERKSLSDLVGCVGSGRARFERHLAKLAAYDHAYLLIEANVDEVLREGWRGTVTAKQVIGSVLAWSLRFGVAPLFVGGRQNGAATVRKLVELALRQKEKARRISDGPSPSRTLGGSRGRRTRAG